jgi:hypothetical protein
VAGWDGPGDAPWRVFLSYTCELRNFPEKGSYVAEPERAVSATGHVIVDMADFPAEGRPAAQLCEERVQGLADGAEPACPARLAWSAPRHSR